MQETIFDKKKFIDAVVKKKTELSLSSRDAAGEIGISHSALCRFINGSGIELNSCLFICNWLKMSIDDFIIKNNG